MKKSDLFKQQRSQKLDAQAAILDKAKAENREMNAEELSSFNALHEESETLRSNIVTAERAEAVELEIASRLAGGSISPGGGEEKEINKMQQRFSINRAIRAVNPGSEEKLDGLEKEVHEIGIAETRGAKVKDEVSGSNVFSLPLSFMRASQQTVTQDSGSYGGALVQNQAPRIVDPLRPLLFLESLGATFLPGLIGGNLPLIVASDFSMEFLAEGATGSTQKKQYAGPTLNPKRAFGAVSLTNQWIMQSSAPAENLVMNGLRQGFAKLLQQSAINGAGTPAPLGVLGTSGVNAAADVAAAFATWARIVELQGLIEEDDATEQSLGYLIHPKVKAALKQITKDAGSGRFLLENDSIDGVKFASSSLVPTLDVSGTPVYPIIYGDWAQMFIGQWGAVNIKVNPYSEDLADSVRLTLNTHADVAIANPKAFAKNAFIKTA